MSVFHHQSQSFCFRGSAVSYVDLLRKALGNTCSVYWCTYKYIICLQMDELSFLLRSITLLFRSLMTKESLGYGLKVEPLRLCRGAVQAWVPRGRRRLSWRASPRNARRESSINITEASPNLFHYPGILNCRCTETRGPALCKLIQ